MENLTGGTPPVRPLPCVVPCKLYFVTNQITYTKLAGSGSYVKQFEHIAVEAGEVSAENIQNLRRNAAQVLNCLPDEIHIDVKEAESETYVYDVRVPLKNIIGAAKMLGISEEENRVEYHFKGVVLAPKEDEEDEKPDHDDGDHDSVLSAS